MIQYAARIKINCTVMFTTKNKTVYAMIWLEIVEDKTKINELVMFIVMFRLIWYWI